MNDLRSKIIDLAASIALNEVENTGRGYKEVIKAALEEARLRLNISETEFIKVCKEIKR